MSTPRWHRLLANRSVAFVGDSIQSQLFVSFACRLHASGLPMHRLNVEWLDAPSKSCHGQTHCTYGHACAVFANGLRLCNCQGTSLTQIAGNCIHANLRPSRIGKLGARKDAIVYGTVAAHSSDVLLASNGSLRPIHSGWAQLAVKEVRTLIGWFPGPYSNRSGLYPEPRHKHGSPLLVWRDAAPVHFRGTPSGLYMRREASQEGPDSGSDVGSDGANSVAGSASATQAGEDASAQSPCGPSAAASSLRPEAPLPAAAAWNELTRPLLTQAAVPVIHSERPDQAATPVVHRAAGEGAARHAPPWAGHIERYRSHAGRQVDCTHWCQPGEPERWSGQLEQILAASLWGRGEHGVEAPPHGHAAAGEEELLGLAHAAKLERLERFRPERRRTR